jgi:hypothetical protein
MKKFIFFLVILLLGLGICLAEKTTTYIKADEVVMSIRFNVLTKNGSDIRYIPMVIKMNGIIRT